MKYAILILILLSNTVVFAQENNDDCQDRWKELQALYSGEAGWTAYVLESTPVLIGGLDSLQSIISNTKQATQSSIEATVFVSAIIDTTGAPYDLKIECGIDKSIDESVLNALGQMQFIPGKQRGRKVKGRMYLPVEI